MSQLNKLTLKQAQEGLKKGEFSSAELVDACLEEISAVDGEIKAFVTVCRHPSTGYNAGKPLSGIPIAIKDNFCTKNLRTTASAKILSDYVPVYESTVTQKLKDAGAIIIGKTNMDAWAHGSSTETSDFFTTKNPHDLAKLPGGSSGGSAAAVAAHETIAAIGSETAGSIRQPAAWCGVVGLKPTYGRVSRYGVIAMASSTDSPGPITKTVEDAAIILNIIAGADGYDATASPCPPDNYTEGISESIEGLKVGLPEEYLKVAEPEIAGIIEKEARRFEKMGAKLIPVKLFDPTYAISVYTILQRSEVSSNLGRYDGVRYGFNREYFGDEAKRRILLGTYCLSAGYYDAFYLKAQKVRTIICRDFNDAFREVDVIIGPTAPSAALPVGSSRNHPMFGEVADVLVEPSTIAGLPGITVNAGLTTNKLPVGMQIIGPQFAEKLILRVAYNFEQHE